ncbi:hypothetical protein F511_23917 [Dorcoceras hygrometricum]|uniref:Uncharacterized protein n=1 Tax=Dorcoceras hygrometricum TaxID=472368 RepID=A0A2Z7BRJ6_9LAMI|nr:hypothetical protein F511_23917 [Dorcoceras hygrometricum]
MFGREYCVRAVRLCRLFLKSVHRVFGRFCAGRDLLAPSGNLNFGNCCSEGNADFTAGHGFNPADGALGGG